MLVWLDGRTNTKAQPQENFGRELMELFTIGVGTTPRPTSTPARACSPGWNLRAPGAGDGTALRVRLQRRRSTTRPPRSSASRSTRTAARTIPARSGVDRDAGRHRPDRRPSRAHPETGPTAGAQALRVLRQRSRAARPAADRRRRRGSTTRSDYQHRSRCVRAAAAVVAVPRSARTTSRATRGRSSSSCARSRKSGGPASR